MAALEIHPICDVFPQMTETELEELAADIKAHGLKVPIVTHRRKIIDGRNRFLACRIAGVKPATVEWDGEGNLTDFVISLNEKRRHLTASQKGMIAAELKPFIEAEIAAKESARKGKGDLGNNSQVDPMPRKAREEAAAAVGVNPRYVSDAERIKEADPAVAAAVKRGDVSIPEARRGLGIGKPNPSVHAGANGHAGGKSKVNGQVVDDPPDIAKARSEGRIPADVVVEVHEPDAATAVADVAEDIAEREAMADDALSDEDWLQALPLFGQLEGSPLTIFRADAVAYRLLERPRQTYKHHADRAFKKVRNNRGAFIWRARSFLSVDHPSKWVRCAATDQGGCGGSGLIPMIGKCPACQGRGYRING